MGVERDAATGKLTHVYGDAGNRATADPTFKLTVTYALGHDQEHPGLTADQVEQGVGAFLSDLVHLRGEGITKLVAEIELPPCEARLYHGPGHQSSTRCHRRGTHVTHEAVYGSDRQTARWRDGDYTSKLRAKGIEFDPETYPENMAMTGFFDEPPQEDDDGE